MKRTRKRFDSMITSSYISTMLLSRIDPLCPGVDAVFLVPSTTIGALRTRDPQKQSPMVSAAESRLIRRTKRQRKC